MPESPLRTLLDQVVAEWANRSARSGARFRRERVAERAAGSPVRGAAQRAFEDLLALPPGERLPWLDYRSWNEEGVILGALLLDEAEALPAAERIELPRLAARVSGQSDVSRAPAFALLLDDNLGRAALMEVRALRCRGQLAEARAMFAELEAGFALEDSPRSQLPTLVGDRALTAGLLTLDEYQTAAAETHFTRCARLQRLAGSEESDAELLFGQARLDLVRGKPGDAVDRILRFPPFANPALQRQRLELAIRAGLRTRRPSLVRPLLPPYTSLTVAGGTGPDQDRVTVFEAALRVLEAKPAVALELLAGPQRRLRSAGQLVASLTLAAVAARAELALRRQTQARKALAAGVLTQFTDLPPTPAVKEALAEIAAALASPALTVHFLDRIDLWLLLVMESPGVGMAPQA